MIRYIIRRVLISIPVFLLITVIVYALYALSPGDPVVNIIGYDSFMRMPAEQVQQIRHQYGFDQPWVVRYVHWLGKALRGDLGYPYKGSKTVVQHLEERIPPTLLLMGTSMVLAMIIGIPMGIYMAIRQYSLGDYLLTIVAFAQLSFPSFFIGLAMIYIFALKLDVLPTYGIETIGAPFSILDRARHLIMPATILGVFSAGMWARYARASMLDVMGADYVTVARAKGLSPRAVTVRHIFRNALLPMVTIIALDIPNLLGGAVITEQIFQWPGMGMMTIRATNTRDYPMLMGILLVSAVMILFSNLLSDVLYSMVDPRIRYD